MTGSGLSVPIAGGELLSGIWQGIYLWEHRLASYDRKVIVTVVVDK